MVTARPSFSRAMRPSSDLQSEGQHSHREPEEREERQEVRALCMRSHRLGAEHVIEQPGCDGARARPRAPDSAGRAPRGGCAAETSSRSKPARSRRRSDPGHPRRPAEDPPTATSADRANAGTPTDRPGSWRRATGSIVGTAMTEAARQARTPPTTPPSVPPPAMHVTARLPVCGSNLSLTNDQKAEITDAPKSAVCK